MKKKKENIHYQYDNVCYTWGVLTAKMTVLLDYDTMQTQPRTTLSCMLHTRWPKNQLTKRHFTQLFLVNWLLGHLYMVLYYPNTALWFWNIPCDIPVSCFGTFYAIIRHYLYICLLQCLSTIYMDYVTNEVMYVTHSTAMSASCKGGKNESKQHSFALQGLCMQDRNICDMWKSNIAKGKHNNYMAKI
jgi:hypothetical protein